MRSIDLLVNMAPNAIIPRYKFIMLCMYFFPCNVMMKRIRLQLDYRLTNQSTAPPDHKAKHSFFVKVIQLYFVVVPHCLFVINESGKVGTGVIKRMSST